MTLAELHALDVPALWAGLSAEHQAEIGAAAVAMQFAQLVAEDDGDDAGRDDRQAAEAMAAEAGAGVAAAVEQAFPEIQWWNP